MQDFVHSKDRGAFEHGIDRSRQLMRQDGQRFALAMLVVQAGQRLLPCRIMPEDQHGCVGKGPLEVRVAAFLARGAIACARGFPGTRDQAAVRDAILDAGAPVDIGAFVEQHEAEERADTGHGLSQIQGLRLVLRGGLQEGEVQSLEPLVIIGDARQVDCNGLLDRGIGKALGHAVTIGCVGDLCANLGEVGLTGRMLDMRQKRRAFTHQMGTAPQEVTGGAQRGRIDRGWRPHAAAQESSHLLGIALVIFGLAPVESFHREGVPKDEGHTRRSAKVSEPVPGEETFNGHNQTVPIRRNGFQKGFRSGCHIAVEQDFPVVVPDTDIHTAGMPIYPTVKGVLGSVESHEVFSSCMSVSCVTFFQAQHTTEVCGGGGLNH
jgi:hypothetical protein